MTNMTDDERMQRLGVAKQIAREASTILLKYFQTDRFEVELKQDRSPLTIADRETEAFLRRRIGEHFPDDGIVGEEMGQTPGSNSVRWILDPIDGTKSFICGVPLFGTMIGVEFSGVTQIGCLHFPALDEGIYAMVGQGAWHYRGDDSPRRARVSAKSRLEDCVLLTSEVEAFASRGDATVYQHLSQEVYFCRTWGDAYGYMLVATGRADIMIDPILNVWDAAAVQPIVDEAGGRFSDWRGDGKIDSGDAIGSNGLVHDEVLARIAASLSGD